MKIIDTDNFNGDYPDEQDIAVGIKRRDLAEVMCDALNDWSGSEVDSLRYYKVVEDDYKNRPGFEP